MFRIIFVLSFFLSTACNVLEPDAEKELLQADREFAQYAINNGLNEAFMEYAADNLVLLRQGEYPLLDKSELQDRIVEQKLTESVQEHVLLRWNPVRAEVAESNDLGFTYGDWAIKPDGAGENLTEGNYITIWRRQENGSWEIILDAGTFDPGKVPKVIESTTSN